MTHSNTAAYQKLPREFYARPTLKVARDLIGMRLIRAERGVRKIARIVETEAYQGPEDLAAHSARGRTRRTEVMFGPPGHAYVYLIYGCWNCLNIVTRAAETPHAVLIRAVEPIEGIDQSTWGPGLLCRALDIDRRLNGTDLCSDVLWIEPSYSLGKSPNISRAPRIGVDYAGAWAEKPWRFFDRDSPYVSTVTSARRKRTLSQEPL